MSTEKRMLFHHPYPLPDRCTSGSKVRLIHMVDAFCDIGYEVEVISGYAQERKSKFEQIKEQKKKGRSYDFVYSESSTLPSLMAKRNFLFPLIDVNFFRWCKQQSIPIGLFYRDIHWKYGQFRATTPLYRRLAAFPLYWYDWINYKRLVDHLFLPSLAMVKALPTRWPEDKVSALYPGGDIFTCNKDVSQKKLPKEDLRIFYVGGVTPPLYDLAPLFDVVYEVNGVNLTLCCREDEWEKVKACYKPIEESKVKIIHKAGKDLNKYFFNSGVFALIWKSNPYLDFAMPVKVFEALGYGLPIVTTSGTEVSRFVLKQDIGWVFSTMCELRNLLKLLINNPEVLKRKRMRLEKVRLHHTWQVRAQSVTEILTKNEN